MDHFGNGMDFGVKDQLCFQDAQLGTAHAVYKVQGTYR